MINSIQVPIQALTGEQISTTVLGYSKLNTDYIEKNLPDLFDEVQETLDALRFEMQRRAEQ